MARLQILELPTEHHGDDEVTPWILVIDQASEDIAKALVPADETASIHDAAIQRLTGPSLAERIGARSVLVFEETVDIPANDTTAYLRDGHPASADYEVDGGGKSVEWTPADEAQAHATDGLRNEVERLRAGEEPVTDERITPTPGQWIWHFNRATPEKRRDMAAQILDNMPIARNCFMNDHEAQIERLRAEVERLRGEPERSPKE